MEEIWKEIKGYPNHRVSNLGKIKSMDYMHTGKEHIMSLRKTQDGYPCVNLCYKGKTKTLKVHRLVAETFIENPLNKPCVDHLNTIRDDNRVCNLRWCSTKENSNNPNTIKNTKCSEKRKAAQRKASLCSAKKTSLKVLQFDMEGVFLTSFPSLATASKETGVDASNISKCCYLKIRAAGGYKWRYTRMNVFKKKDNA